MQQKELNVEARVELGSTAMQRARKQGMLPGVVYAAGEDAASVLVNEHDFIMTVRGCVPAQLFRFKSASTALNGKLAIVKEIQQEPLKGKLLHVDFLSIREGQAITVTVPVAIEGEPSAVREGRAMLSQNRHEIDIECVPESIPEVIIVDVSSLEEGESVHAKDIPLPKGAVLKSGADQTIVSLFGNKRLAAAAAKADQAGATSPEADAAASTEEAK